MDHTWCCYPIFDKFFLKKPKIAKKQQNLKTSKNMF